MIEGSGGPTLPSVGIESVDDVGGDASESTGEEGGESGRGYEISARAEIFEKYATFVIRRVLEAAGGVEEVSVTFLPLIPNQPMSFEKTTSPGTGSVEGPAEALPAAGVPVNSW